MGDGDVKSSCCGLDDVVDAFDASHGHLFDGVRRMVVMSLLCTHEHTLAVAFGIWFTRCQSILESGMVIVAVVRCCSETCPQIRRTERKCVFDSRSSRSSDSPFSCRFSLLILRFPSFSYCST